MKVSELIIQLKELKEAYGNLDVKNWSFNSIYDDHDLTEIVGARMGVDDHGKDYIEIN